VSAPPSAGEGSWARAQGWRRIGVLGGSFDPPHCGHVLLATYALSVAPIDGLLVVPAFAHPFGKRMAPFEHRLAMAALAFSALDPARCAISDVESTLAPPSYTVRTLEALRARLPDASFRLLVGPDIVKDPAKWDQNERVRELAPFFVVGRGGHDAGDAEDAPLDLPAVSSTEVRARLAAGRDVRGLVPSVVVDYLEQRGSYRDPA